MKKFIFLLIILLSSYVVFGQFDDYTINKPQTPASPSAAGLGKYGIVPVSYYTGTPNIQIPLYELKYGDFNLPISISYHASGIKVNDVSGWVGLGWSVSAGGCISRSIVGKDDFARLRFNVRTNTDLQSGDLPSEVEATQLYTIYDGESDIYSYNFQGYSGQFVLDEDFNVHFLNNSDGIDITCNTTLKSSCGGVSVTQFYEAEFEAIDLLGNQYIFSIKEFTKRYDYNIDYFPINSNNPTNDYLYGEDTNSSSDNIDDCMLGETTSWNLERINLVNNKGSILFSYDQEFVKYSTGLQGCIQTQDLSQSTLEWANTQDAFQYSKLEHETYKISEIYYTGNDLKIKFINSISRQDILNTHALQDIELWNNNNLISSWEFTYDYFISNFSIGNDKYNNPLNKRLRLSSLVQKSSQGDENNPYFFEYYGDVNTSLKLPPRNSYDGFDHWGYCNKNIDNNDATSPSCLFSTIETPISVGMVLLDASGLQDYLGYIKSLNITKLVPVFAGGDRTPRSNYAKANALKKIIYPTKGYSKYNYEIHHATNSFVAGSSFNDSIGGLRVKQIINFDGQNEYNTRNFYYSTGTVYGVPQYVKPRFEVTNVGGILYTAFNTGAQEYNSSDGYNLFSYCQNNLSSFGGDYIAYDEVKEVTSTGSITYNYISGSDFSNNFIYNIAFVQESGPDFYRPVPPQTGYVYPFGMSLNSGELNGDTYKRGLIEKETYRNTTNTIIRSIDYSYSHIDICDVFCNRSFPVSPNSSQPYFISCYSYKTGKNFLSNKTTTNFDIIGNQTLTTQENYEYDVDHELLKWQSISTSEGGSETTRFQYPLDYASSSFTIHQDDNGDEMSYAIEQLIQRNIFSQPIEILKTRTVGGTEYITEGRLNLFKYWNYDGNWQVLPKSSLFRATSPATQYYPSSWSDLQIIPNGGDFEYNFSYSSDYYSKQSYSDYTSNGKLKEYSGIDDIPKAYLWGYNNQYPIAESTNALSDEIFYTSFEDSPIIAPTTTALYSFDSSAVVTGRFSLRTQNIDAGEEYYFLERSYPNPTSSQKYNYSGWVYSTGPSAQIYMFYDNDAEVDNSYAGHTNVSTSVTNEWVFLKGELTVPSTARKLMLRVDNNSIGTVWFDDLKFYPEEAQMTTYTYDPLIGMTSQTDPNGETTYYEYDDFGRLFRILDNDQNVVKENQYNYVIQ